MRQHGVASGLSHRRACWHTGGMRYVLIICVMLLAAMFCYMVLDMAMQTGRDVANSHPW